MFTYEKLIFVAVIALAAMGYFGVLTPVTGLVALGVLVFIWSRA